MGQAGGVHERHTPPPPAVKASDDASLFCVCAWSKTAQSTNRGVRCQKTHRRLRPAAPLHPSIPMPPRPAPPTTPRPPRLGALVARGAAGAVCGFAGVAALVALVTALGDGAHVVETHQVRESVEGVGPECESAEARGLAVETLPPPIRSPLPTTTATHARPRRHRLPAHRLATGL